MGNQEAEHVSSITVLGDMLPPRTALAAGVPSFSSGAILYADEGTPFSLIAVDDLMVVGDGAGVGVAQSFFGVAQRRGHAVRSHGVNHRRRLADLPARRAANPAS